VYNWSKQAKNQSLSLGEVLDENKNSNGGHDFDLNKCTLQS
jgi:hypothetical protein